MSLESGEDVIYSGVMGETRTPEDPEEIQPRVEQHGTDITMSPPPIITVSPLSISTGSVLGSMENIIYSGGHGRGESSEEI